MKLLGAALRWARDSGDRSAALFLGLELAAQRGRLRWTRRALAALGVALVLLAGCAAQYDHAGDGSYLLGREYPELAERAALTWQDTFNVPCSVWELRVRPMAPAELAEACEFTEGQFAGCLTLTLDDGQPAGILVDEGKDGAELELLLGHEAAHACVVRWGVADADPGHELDRVWRGPESFCGRMVAP